MPYGKIVLQDGTEALFEIEEPSVGLVSDEKGLVRGLESSFEKIMNLVEGAAKSVHEGWHKIPRDARPNEYTISFGIKLNAEAGVVFAKAGSEGSFQVTLKWTSERSP
jgi:hypothetical protein